MLGFELAMILDHPVILLKIHLCAETYMMSSCLSLKATPCYQGLWFDPELGLLSFVCVDVLQLLQFPPIIQAYTGIYTLP